MLKTIRKGFFSTDSRKGRGYISSKYIVTGEKRRRREFFTTGCASCRKNRPIDFFEASCGACAPRSVRKRGVSVGFPCLRTLRHRHSQARRRWGRQRFSPVADAAGFTTPRGSAAPSWLILYMIHGVLPTHFNNHYFALTWNRRPEADVPRRGSVDILIDAGRQT